MYIWFDNIWLIQIQIYWLSISKTNTNTNIFGLTKKGRIQIWIWIFGLVFANTNMNTNICHTQTCKMYRASQNSFVYNFWGLVNTEYSVFCQRFNLLSQFSFFWIKPVWKCRAIVFLGNLGEIFMYIGFFYDLVYAWLVFSLTLLCFKFCTVRKYIFFWVKIVSLKSCPCKRNYILQVWHTLLQI